MQTFITTKELRTEFPKIRKQMQRGGHFVIIHRSRPIGELLPLKEWTHSNGFLSFFSKPAKRFTFRSRKSAVELVREERDRR